MKICLATNNVHKVNEIKAVFDARYEIVGLKEIGCFEELPETGTTLEENSKQKAEYIYDKFKVACIADDSGLEVACLDNKPGVDTAHYAGPERDANANMNRVLLEMQDCTHRDATFKTVITYINQEGESHQFIGAVKGSITKEKRGNQGFGYDPIFVPENQNYTFAEMDMEEKNKISHRSRALHLFMSFLQK